MDHGRRRRATRAATALAAAGLLTTLLAACQLPGDTYVVTTTADQPDAAPGDGICDTGAGACSLRAAVTEANAGPGLANIELGDGATYVLSIAGSGEDANSTGDLDLTATMAVNGHSTIDGGGLDRVLDVHAGTLFLDGPTVTGGRLPTPEEWDAANRRGGGIRVRSGAQLVASEVTIRDNEAWHGGGGISGAGNVSLHRSTVRDNESSGGILDFEGELVPGHGAGIAMEAGALTLTESTVTGNVITFGSQGSGIYGTGSATVALVRSTVDHNQASGVAVIAPTVTVTTSTISANVGVAALGGSAVSVTGSTIVHANGFALWNGGSRTVAGSILATTASPVCLAAITSLGSTITTDASCGATGPGDHQSTDPFLGPLADNGGPTRTHLPYPSSPALDAIPAGTPTVCDGSAPTDQRGQTRPAGSACDIGAVEGSSASAPAPLALTVTDAGSAPDAAPGDGLCTTVGGGCTLPAAVDETNAWPPTDTITIAPGTNPTLGPAVGLVVTDGLLIQGNGATITGGTSKPVLTVDGPSTTVERVTFAGATGIKAVRGPLTLREVTVDRSNVIAEVGADLSIIRSAITGGVAVGGHGTIESSTVSATFGYAASTFGTGGPGAGLDVRSSTLVGAPAGAAVAVSREASSVPFTLRGSVVLAGAASVCGPFGAPTSLGFNVVSDSSCGFAATGDHQGASPLVQGPAANGGPTSTRLLYANSPAVDAIPAGTAGLCDATVPTDQRGLPRQVGGACDAGAAEGPAAVSASAPLALVVDRSADGGDVRPGDGACLAAAGGCTLRAAVDEANAWPFTDQITIGAGIAPVLSLAGSDEDLNRSGDLDVSGPLTITGAGTVVNGAHLDRVLDHHVGSLSLVGLTITGSGDPGYLGGAVRSSKSLSVRNSIVTGNDTDGITAGGPLTMSRVSVTDNTGEGVTTFDTASIDRSTFARNTRSGINSYGPTTILRSTASGNGIFQVLGNGSNQLTITASTLVGGPGEFTLFVDYQRPTNLVAVAITSTDPAKPLCANGVTTALWSRLTDATCVAGGTGTAVVPTLGLGPLADNGGGLATHLPGPTSALLDVIPFGQGSCTTLYLVDQRGQGRPQGLNCDVGAVERQQ